MFRKKKENSLNFKTNNHKMKNRYNVNSLVVANLEYINDEIIPIIKRTEQKYIFEIINENGKDRYKEVFTGFIADKEENNDFILPYVVNITKVKEEIPSLSNTVSKYSLLLILDEINTKKTVKKFTKTNK